MREYLLLKIIFIGSARLDRSGIRIYNYYISKKGYTTLFLPREVLFDEYE